MRPVKTKNILAVFVSVIMVGAVAVFPIYGDPVLYLERQIGIMAAALAVLLLSPKSLFADRKTALRGVALTVLVVAVFWWGSSVLMRSRASWVYWASRGEHDIVLRLILDMGDEHQQQSVRQGAEDRVANIAVR